MEDALAAAEEDVVEDATAVALVTVRMVAKEDVAQVALVIAPADVLVTAKADVTIPVSQDAPVIAQTSVRMAVKGRAVMHVV